MDFYSVHLDDQNGIIFKWNKDGKIVGQLKGHSNTVICLCILKDYLVNGSSDNSIIIWNSKGKCMNKL